MIISAYKHCHVKGGQAVKGILKKRCDIIVGKAVNNTVERLSHLGSVILGLDHAKYCYVEPRSLSVLILGSLIYMANIQTL